MEKKFRTEISSLNCNLISVLVISIAFTLISISMARVNFAFNADEGYYFNYAAYIAKHGVHALSDLFAFYINDRTNWVYPNPLRIGFIILSSLWFKILGYSFLNLAFLSLFSFCIYLFAAFGFIKEYFGEKIAVLSLVLLAFSPLNMAMARRALLDSASNLFILLSLWLFFESFNDKDSRKTFWFVLVYSFTILVKENNVLLSLFFAAYLILRKAIFKADLRVRDLLAATLIPGVIVGVIYVLSAGSIYRPIEVAKIILASPATNKYAILFCSGPWFRCLIDFMLLSPWVCLLAIGFFFHYLVKNEKREEIVYLLLFCSSLIFLFSFFAKNVRYVINLDFPIRLFAVLMLVELKKLLFKNRATYILVAFVCLIALFDYLNFYNLFAIRRIYDPISQWLLQAWRIVPLGA